MSSSSQLAHTGSARDYIKQFKRMAAQLPGLQDDVLAGIFIKGLKHDLWVAVRTQQPTSLGHMMELALVIDESQSEKVIESGKGVLNQKGSANARLTGGLTRVIMPLASDGGKDK